MVGLCGGKMLKIFTVSFFGHRKVERILELEEQIKRLICDLTETNDYVEILVGRNGEFDRLVSSVVRVIRRERQDRCSHTLVLPYVTAEYRDNRQSFENYYDVVELFQSRTAPHFKAAIQARNCQMVDRSDLIVFYLERVCGGTYQTYQYAVKQKKQIIKL